MLIGLPWSSTTSLWKARVAPDSHYVLVRSTSAEVSLVLSVFWGIRRRTQHIARRRLDTTCWRTSWGHWVLIFLLVIKHSWRLLQSRHWLPYLQCDCPPCQHGSLPRGCRRGLYCLRRAHWLRGLSFHVHIFEWRMLQVRISTQLARGWVSLGRKLRVPDPTWLLSELYNLNIGSCRTCSMSSLLLRLFPSQTFWIVSRSGRTLRIGTRCGSASLLRQYDSRPTFTAASCTFRSFPLSLVTSHQSRRIFWRSCMVCHPAPACHASSLSPSTCNLNWTWVFRSACSLRKSSASCLGISRLIFRRWKDPYRIGTM